jgi:hypothetical protein
MNFIRFWRSENLQILAIKREGKCHSEDVNIGRKIMRKLFITVQAWSVDWTDPIQDRIQVNFHQKWNSQFHRKLRDSRIFQDFALTYFMDTQCRSSSVHNVAHLRNFDILVLSLEPPRPPVHRERLNISPERKHMVASNWLFISTYYRV